MAEDRYQDFGYDSATVTLVQGEVGPTVEALLSRHAPPPGRLIELGCGNGNTCARAAALGYVATGIDASESGIRIARAAIPSASFHVDSVYEPLHEKFGTFEVAVSLDVIEHLYDPRLFAKRVFQLLEPGGRLFLSTPYHGYLKNLALALTGSFEHHFGALWDGGHIKFFSIKTLTTVLSEQGFVVDEVVRIGRVPPIAKWMVFVAHKPI